MAEYGAPQSDFWDKAVPAFCVMLLVAALISVPFMYNDSMKAKEKQWQSEGCRMYDNSKMADVPVKCLNEFTDHYKAQNQRTQPPEVIK